MNTQTTMPPVRKTVTVKQPLDRVGADESGPTCHESLHLGASCC